MRIICWTGGLVAVVAGILFAYGKGSRQKEELGSYAVSTAHTWACWPFSFTWALR